MPSRAELKQTRLSGSLAGTSQPVLQRFFRLVMRGRSEATPVGLLSGVTVAVGLVATLIIGAALIAWYIAR